MCDRVLQFRLRRSALAITGSDLWFRFGLHGGEPTLVMKKYIGSIWFVEPRGLVEKPLEAEIGPGRIVLRYDSGVKVEIILASMNGKTFNGNYSYGRRMAGKASFELYGEAERWAGIGVWIEGALKGNWFFEVSAE
jgi:hypothetical protein